MIVNLRECGSGVGGGAGGGAGGDGCAAAMEARLTRERMARARMARVRMVQARMGEHALSCSRGARVPDAVCCARALLAELRFLLLASIDGLFFGFAVEAYLGFGGDGKDIWIEKGLFEVWLARVHCAERQVWIEKRRPLHLLH